MTKNATNSNLSELESSTSPDPKPVISYRFPKKERLCSKRAFDLLFSNPKHSFYSGSFWVIYQFDLPEEYVKSPSVVAFTAPRRVFRRAVDRNRLKRLMREAYRLHKHSLIQKLTDSGHNLSLLIKYNSKEIRTFKQVEWDMIRVLRQLEKEV